jgi:hypothetical protein
VIRFDAPAALWICGQRQEALPTNPQGQQQQTEAEVDVLQKSDSLKSYRHTE